MKPSLFGAISTCVLAFGLVTQAQAVAVSGQGTWETTLQGRDLDGNPATFEAYFDTALNITWLADENVAWTIMTWADANAWAASLNVNGITGWRLPTVTPVNGTSFDIVTTTDGTSDKGTATTTTDGTDGGWRDASGNPVSEMGHMFYVTLGNLGHCDPTFILCTAQAGSGLSNTGPFSNLLSSIYWTDTEFNSSNAWDFNFNWGYQWWADKENFTRFVWAVHAGDVGGTEQSVFTIEPASVSVNEIERTLTFTVSRSDKSAAETLYVSTVQNQGSINNGDYVGKLNEPLVFAAEQDTQPVTVTIYDDTEIEDDETFGLIVQQSPTDPVDTFLVSATFTIQDNDTVGHSPVLSVSPTAPIEFGTVPVGQPKLLPIKIVNTGTGNLIGKCEINSPFSFGYNGMTFDIAAGKSKDEIVLFSSPLVGSGNNLFIDQLQCTSNGGNILLDVTGSTTLHSEAPPTTTDNIPHIWGVFVGLYDGNDRANGLHAYKTANDLKQLFIDNLGVNPVRIKVITNLNRQIDTNVVKEAIRSTISFMDDNDILVLYFGSHGSFSGFKGLDPATNFSLSALWPTDYSDVEDNHKDEITRTPGDEYIVLDYNVPTYTNELLYDDDLEFFLDTEKGNAIQKWIFVDACFSGGFWGPEPEDNNLSDDDGDLSKLSNIGFISASPEWFLGFVNPLDGNRSIFGGSLRDAFSKNASGKLNSDLDEDGRLSLQEIYGYVSDWQQNLLDHSEDFVDTSFGITSFVFTNETTTIDKVKFFPVMHKSDDFPGQLTTSPIANAGVDQVRECTNTNGALIVLDASGSSDPGGNSLTYTWTGNFGEQTGEVAQVILPLGTHTITLTARNSLGATDNDTVEITVEDPTAPSLDITVNPEILWPPNHKMVPIAAAITASDTCDSTPIVGLPTIIASEGDNALGDGNTTNDIVIGQDGAISLRAERSGKGVGRVYTITYTATDESGNTSTADATVTVPHNKGGK